MSALVVASMLIVAHPLTAYAQGIDRQTESGNIINQQTGQVTQVPPNASPSSPSTTPGQEEKSVGCSILGKDSIINCLDAGVTWLIKNTLLRIAGVVLWLCANMLNFALQIGVLEFSKWAPPALYEIWIVVRQIVSLAIVFAGLWLGFMYIIGRQDTFARYIGWVIIYALFVNFSYPIARVLIDISNIVALNIYSSALPGALGGAGNAVTAGMEIMRTLGLQDLVSIVTTSETGGNLYKNITSTPAALITVAFVFYAAYVFFMATAILAVRTAVLVFLTIASPLLLVDSVIPKLGEVASKLRKMYFEQLVVAPVFVIMLAITLKFMTVFKGTPQAPGPMGSANVGMQNSLYDPTGASVGVFFGVLMMLVMLHIMLKVTRSIAGEAGTYATNVMGKVGGFGLAAATGGAGLLARGTIGQAAMRVRDSSWMDKMKDTKMGRGLHGFSNSLAQSTYDARNIGMVSKGLATAGITGGMGLTMQAGSKRGFEQVKNEREEKILKFGSNIQNDRTRENYFNKANKGFVYAKIDESKLAEVSRAANEKKLAAVAAFAGADASKRASLMDQTSNDKPLQDKLKITNEYLAVDAAKDADGIKKKVDALLKLGDPDMAKKIWTADPLKDISRDLNEKIEEKEKELEEMADKDALTTVKGSDGKDIQITKEKKAQREIEMMKANRKKEVEAVRKKIEDEYKSRFNSISRGRTVDFILPDDNQPSAGGMQRPEGPQGSGQGPNAFVLHDDEKKQQELYDEINATAERGRARRESAQTGIPRPGGSDTAQYASSAYERPAYLRKEETSYPPKPAGMENAQEAPSRVNPLDVRAAASGTSTTYNGVEDQEFAIKAEQQRIARQKAALGEEPSARSAGSAGVGPFTANDLQRTQLRNQLRKPKEEDAQAA